MTVNELMALLSKMPQDATVVVYDTYENHEVTAVGGDDGDTEVIIYLEGI